MLSAFFSGSETGLTAASRAKIHKLKVEGHRRAAMVSKLHAEKERLIGAILLGNNAVNIAASVVATSIAIRLFGDEGMVYVTIVMTLVVLIFAEVLPKTYAFNNSEKVALFVAPVFIYLVKFLSPITDFIQWIVNRFIHIRDSKGTQSDDDVSGTEELRGAIALHHHEGAVMKQDKDMLGSILDLAETEVSEVMTARTSMFTIDIATSTEALVEEVLNSPHTRIPFWQDKPDNIIGILHVKDLLAAIQNINGNLKKLDIQPILTKPWFVPENTTLNSQLRAFRDKRLHFCLVIDEYGDLQGMITLEDIIEEIVGQIEDEHDITHEIMKQEEDGSYRLEGLMTIRDINRELDWNLPEDEAATIAGLLIHETGDIPEEGEHYTFHGIQFVVVKKENNQIMTLKIKKVGEET